MDDAVAAAENNARWCDLVCRSHGIPTAFEDSCWVALRRTPERYPDAVTLRPGATVAEVLESVEDGPGCSVKDSFADLDLAPHGFEVLFEAQWIVRGPALPTVKAAELWLVVETAEELAEWAPAAGAGEALRPEILADESVRVLVSRGANGIEAGAIVNLAGSVAGLSNVFRKRLAPDKTWLSLPTAVAGLFPWAPIVGYESGEHRLAALGAGFSEIGPLRVWTRTAA